MFTHNTREPARKALRGAFADCLSAFGSSRDGNIAILFVFMFAVLLFFAGGAVDYTRYNAVRADMSESLDAAALAMAQIDAMNGPEIRNLTGAQREEYLKDQGRKFFTQNFKHAGWVEDLELIFSIDNETITPSATGRIRTLLLHVAEKLQSGTNKLTYLNISAGAEITRSLVGNTEVALVLDITGSMSGQRIIDLKDAAKELIDILVRDDQTDYYTKLALAPYSMAVNVGNLATQARGAITAGRPITGATWMTGTQKNITGATRANPVVITSSAHGFSNGDHVYISGVSGMTQINNQMFTVASATTNTFALSGVNGTGFSSYSSGGIVRKCERALCEVVLTSTAHNVQTDDHIHITGVNGMTQLNDSTWRVTRLDANRLVLHAAYGPAFSNYSSGGTLYCTQPGCEYHHFTTMNPSRNISGATKANPVVITTSSNHGFTTGDSVMISGVNGMTQLNNRTYQITRVNNTQFRLNNIDSRNFGTYSSGGTVTQTNTFRITNCISERTGAQAATDAPPSSAPLGRVYAGSGNPCPQAQITPLSRNKTALKTAVDNMQIGGSTAGHLGSAWGWYLISPNFGYLFAEDSRPAPYGTEDLMKAVIIMTDGEYNTPFCNGVIAQNAGSGSGSAADKINCNSPNGSPFNQAVAVCNQMKAAGVLVYTVGFMIENLQEAKDILENCASGPPYVYIAEDGASLKNAFSNIALDIASLHISR